MLPSALTASGFAESHERRNNIGYILSENLEQVAPSVRYRLQRSSNGRATTKYQGESVTCKLPCNASYRPIAIDHNQRAAQGWPARVLKLTETLLIKPHNSA